MTEIIAPAHEIIWSLTNAAVPSACLHLIAETGVADRLGEPSTAADLAQRCALDPAALDRVLRLLVSHGVFERDGALYRHNTESRLLRSDHPRSMRAFARMMGLPVFSDTWNALGHSLKTGAPAIEQVTPGGLWPYLRSHPDEADIFNSAMQSKAHADIDAVLSAYDFRPFNAIADVAGGRGHLLKAVLETAPNSHGILFETPEVIESLLEPGPRLTYRAGDFFTDPLPRADCYLLMEILHDWNDPEAVHILEAIRQASAPGATVLILEGIREEQGNDPRAATLDVIMLAVTGGRERTADQHGRLLRETGFRPTAMIETTGPIRILEALAV
ncbi:methyltransferase [Nakamurella sp. GG22]